MELDPHIIAEKRLTLAEEYSRISDEMAGLEMLEAKFFQDTETMYRYDTDKAKSRAFNATEEGLRLITLKRREKAIRQEMTALNSFLRVKENQGRNLY